MGFWKKLGKIASFAAPIIAAPFTGGATLALIGAGSGAAGGALSGGGLKNIALGAGLGAVPGLGKMGKLGRVGTKMFGHGAGMAGQATSGGASKIGNVNGIVDAMAKQGQQSLGGKLMDTLTSPEILKAGIGAGLQGAFGGDDVQSYKGSVESQRLLEKALQMLKQGGLARINLAQQPLKLGSVAPINFNPNIPNLPFQLGLNNAGLKAPEPVATDPALEELKKILAGL